MLARSIVVALTTVTLVTAALSALPARAAEPPFEMEFPQELAVTTFHNDWLSARSDGREHLGNDLMAPKLTRVYSIADGVVVKVSASSRAGRYLIIEHAGGWESYYIHLNNDNPDTNDGDAPWLLTLAPGIEVGATVLAGQHIGYVGNSGNAEGGMSHTHFELHYRGRAINPYRLLEAAYERAQRKIRREILIEERQLLDGLQIV